MWAAETREGAGGRRGGRPERVAGSDIQRRPERVAGSDIQRSHRAGSDSPPSHKQIFDR